MSKVELYPLAITDLSYRYARRLENNKILHYRISSIQSLVGVPGADPFQSVKDYILEMEPNAEVVLKDSVLPKRVIEGGGALSVDDVSSKVLKGLPKVRRELNRIKGKRTILEYSEVGTPLDYPIKYTEQITQTAVFDPDSLSKWESAEIGSGFREVVREMTLGAKLAYLASRIGLQRRVPSKYFFHRVVPCTYLTYTYEEPYENLAIDAIRSDLKILSQNGLILGNLSMPSTIYLADTVGSGLANKAIFCFVFINRDKLSRIVGNDALNNPLKNALEVLGVRSETLEGGLGHHIGNKNNYEIEEVEVGDRPSDRNRQAYIQSYLENVEQVNAAAKSQREKLKNLDIQTESYHSKGINGRPSELTVSIKISKKDESGQ